MTDLPVIEREWLRRKALCMPLTAAERNLAYTGEVDEGGNDARSDEQLAAAYAELIEARKGQIK